jgi:hypothetical protein
MQTTNGGRDLPTSVSVRGNYPMRRTIDTVTGKAFHWNVTVRVEGWQVPAFDT